MISFKHKIKAEVAEHDPSPTGYYATPITLMLPERIVAPPPWVGHVPFAFWIIEVMRPRRFVELGTHSGNSFCAFLQAAAASGQARGEYFAVDHWRGDEHAGRYNDEIYKDLERYLETRYHRSSALLRMTFDQALAHFADNSIDLLHIDGLHTYDAVQHDFEAWLPKMSERGIMLLHDTAVRERDFGVHRLFATLSERYPTFQFVHSHGLGVVQTGTAAQPEPIAALLRGESDSSGIDPRLYFERVGNSVVDRYYFEQLSTQMKEIELASVRRSKQELEAALASQKSLRTLLEVYESQMRETVKSTSARQILNSGFFDPKAYQENVGLPGLDDVSLAQHYLDAGEVAGLVPSSHFDPEFYREEYPDVVSEGINMLFHYVAHGRAEGRLPTRGRHRNSTKWWLGQVRAKPGRE